MIDIVHSALKDAEGNPATAHVTEDAFVAVWEAKGWTRATPATTAPAAGGK
jgi:hypothetical protein